jgi:hypothetical protein
MDLLDPDHPWHLIALILTLAVIVLVLVVVWPSL